MELCLVDTSSWIEALRKEGDASVRRRVSELLKQGRAATCELIILELWNGARGSREQTELEKVADALPSLPIDKETWKLAYETSRSCRRNGITVPASDILIQACSRRHGATIEHNDAHFELIEGLLATK